MIMQEKDGYKLRCDKCKVKTALIPTYNLAIDVLHDDGWKQGATELFCPSCVKLMKEGKDE